MMLYGAVGLACLAVSWIVVHVLAPEWFAHDHLAVYGLACGLWLLCLLIGRKGNPQ